MSWKNPGKLRARTCSTKSPSRLEALHFIDSAIHVLPQTIRMRWTELTKTYPCWKRKKFEEWAKKKERMHKKPKEARGATKNKKKQGSKRWQRSTINAAAGRTCYVEKQKTEWRVDLNAEQIRQGVMKIITLVVVVVVASWTHVLKNTARAIKATPPMVNVHKPTNLTQIPSLITSMIALSCFCQPYSHIPENFKMKITGPSLKLHLLILSKPSVLWDLSFFVCDISYCPPCLLFIRPPSLLLYACLDVLPDACQGDFSQCLSKIYLVFSKLSPESRSTDWCTSASHDQEIHRHSRWLCIQQQSSSSSNRWTQNWPLLLRFHYVHVGSVIAHRVEPAWLEFSGEHAACMATLVAKMHLQGHQSKMEQSWSIRLLPKLRSQACKISACSCRSKKLGVSHIPQCRLSLSPLWKKRVYREQLRRSTRARINFKLL